MKYIQLFYYYILQIYGLLIFHKRIRIYGIFKLGNRKNIKIGKNTSINEKVYIQGFNYISIGENVTLSRNVQLYDSGLDYNRQHIKASITIDDNVWIGASSIVLPNVHIGKGARVGAGSVVTKNVPPFTLVCGNPARVIKKLENTENS